MHLVDRLQGPSVRYLLGTDHMGRDYLSRIIHGARVSLTVGFAATTVNVVVAVLIGGTSGFFGGRADLAAQRFVDAWMAFPGLLLLLTVMSLVGRGMPQIILVLGIAGVRWSWFFGQVKGQVKVESVGCQPARPCLNNRRR